MTTIRKSAREVKEAHRPHGTAGKGRREGHSEARGFHRTREDHQHEHAEDYVEMIAALIAERGEARTMDMARRLGVSHVTVTRTLARLQKAGLIATEPYRSVFLTGEGRNLAERVRERHKIVLDFLIAAGVPQAMAEIDSEGIEHHVSPETLQALQRLTEWIGASCAQDARTAEESVGPRQAKS